MAARGDDEKLLVTREKHPVEQEVHRLAFEGKHRALEVLLKKYKSQGMKMDDILNGTDKHGCTPLLLATMMNKIECVKVLLDFGAEVDCRGERRWPVIAEAISICDRDLTRLIYKKVDEKMKEEIKTKSTQFLDALAKADDCYLEMDWDVHSWVPLVSYVLPSDHVSIWKRGNKIRIDSSLLDIAKKGITRGHRSYIMAPDAEGELILTIVEHDDKEYYQQPLFDPQEKPPTEAEALAIIEEDITNLLTSEIVDGDFQPDEISFEPVYSGWIGYRTEKVETVGKYEANVYSVSGLEVETMTRMEHLTKEDIKRLKAFRASRGMDKDGNPMKLPYKDSLAAPDREVDSWNEYIRSPTYIHPGRPIVTKEKSRKFKPSVWMSPDFPLKIESVENLFSAIAKTNDQIKKIRDFMSTKLPAGFPVKFDMHVFPTVSVRVAFTDVAVGVEDDSIFDVPSTYTFMEIVPGPDGRPFKRPVDMTASTA